MSEIVAPYIESDGRRQPTWNLGTPPAPASGFIFQGLSPYVDAAAKADGFEEWGLISKAKGLWPSNQLQNTLGQLVALKPEQRPESLAYAMKVRRMVAVLLEGLDAAILDVTSELELPVPAEIAGRTADGPGPAQAEPEPKPPNRRASRSDGK
jgi:hypothetical protein